MHTPIIMFDKNQDYVVMTLEQVSPTLNPSLFIPLSDRFEKNSFCPCRLAQTDYRPQVPSAWHDLPTLRKRAQQIGQ
jgi:hypothetical protein